MALKPDSATNPLQRVVASCASATIIAVTMILLTRGGCGGAPNVQHTLSVARDTATHYNATVLVPAGTSPEACEKLLRHLVRTEARGRAGNIQVFDDAQAEKLAIYWCDRELTPQEEALCAQHLVAQANFGDGQVRIGR